MTIVEYRSEVRWVICVKRQQHFVSNFHKNNSNIQLNNHFASFPVPQKILNPVASLLAGNYSPQSE